MCHPVSFIALSDSSKLCRSMVMVGVHARRTDYKHHLNVLLGGKLVTKKYFEDAMAHIKEKYR